jgi:hypothetical protein
MTNNSTGRTNAKSTGGIEKFIANMPYENDEKQRMPILTVILAQVSPQLAARQAYLNVS